VTFWLVTLSLLSQSHVAFAELAPPPATAPADPDSNQTLLDADKLLISPADKTFAVDVDLSLNSNLINTADIDYSAESFVSLSTRYQLAPKITLSGEIGAMQKLDDSHETALSDAKIEATYEARPNLANMEIKYNLFSYLPTNADERADEGYVGGVGAGVEIAKDFSLPGLPQPSRVTYGFSMLKNFYSSDTDYLMRSNMTYRLRHSLRFHQHFGKHLSFQLASFVQTGVGFDGRQRSFFQFSEIINYQSSKNLSFYVGHTNEADALEDNAIDTNFNTFDTNESYFVSGAKISF